MPLFSLITFDYNKVKRFYFIFFIFSLLFSCCKNRGDEPRFLHLVGMPPRAMRHILHPTEHCPAPLGPEPWCSLQFAALARQYTREALEQTFPFLTRRSGKALPFRLFLFIGFSFRSAQLLSGYPRRIVMSEERREPPAT